MLETAAPALPWRNGQERVALRPCHGSSACVFLDEVAHLCRAYAARPLECRLYPFLLSQEGSGFKVYAHLSCPAITAARETGAWAEWGTRIRDFFSRPDVGVRVHRSACCFPDYSLSPDEVVEVFAFEPGVALRHLRPRIEQALSATPRLLSALHFVNMFAWQHSFHFDVQEIDGTDCVFARQSAGIFMYWPPLGKNVAPHVIDACFDRMRTVNGGGSLTRIENVSAAEVHLFDPKGYHVSLCGHEYVYARRDIACLGGNKYKSRRGDVNAFARMQAGRYRLRPYAGQDFNACAALFDRWMTGRVQRHGNDLYRWMLEDNRDVHRLLLAHAAQLGLIGCVLEIDGDVVAYTFGYAMDEETFCVLLEVTDLAVKGLPAFVFSRFCADEAVAPYRWINAMGAEAGDDMARTKMSWRPCRMEPVYTVTAMDNTRRPVGRRRYAEKQG